MDAITKLEQEIKNPGKLSRIEAAMLEPVGKMLISFCRQDARFASAVFEKKETLSDCMHEVSKGVTYALSDVEAYRRAVGFYFPAADVDFKCVVVLPAEKSGVVTRGIGRAADADEETEQITMEAAVSEEALEAQREKIAAEEREKLQEELRAEYEKKLSAAANPDNQRCVLRFESFCAEYQRLTKAMQGLPEENRNKIRANVRSALERMLEEMRDE